MNSRKPTVESMHLPAVMDQQRQLKGFPACKFDDGPDALEMALTLVARAVNSGRAFGSEGLQRVNDMVARIRA
jgi:hypothetical protein